MAPWLAKAASKRPKWYVGAIRRLANKLLRAGQRSHIEADDLYAVGCLSLVSDLGRNADTSMWALLRSAKREMVLHVNLEQAHWMNRAPWEEAQRKEDSEDDYTEESHP